MKAQDVGLLLTFGLLIWMIGTVYFAQRGVAVFESGPLRYWLGFIVFPILSAVLCVALLRWRHIHVADWTSAMLLLALPGMFGEAAVLSQFSTLMPKLQMTSAGKYGAFLFMTYGLVLGIAEVVTLRARP